MKNEEMNDDQMQILAGQGYHIAQSVDEFKEKQELRDVIENRRGGGLERLG